MVRFVTVFEPPYVMNGSGMPVVGAMPRFIPTLTATCNMIRPKAPAAINASSRLRARGMIRPIRQSTSR